MQKIGHWVRYWLRYAKKTSERQTKPFNQSPNRGLSGAGGEKNVQGWRKWSTGLNGLCSLTRQAGMPTLPACRYLMPWRYASLRGML